MHSHLLMLCLWALSCLLGMLAGVGRLQLLMTVCAEDLSGDVAEGELMTLSHCCWALGCTLQVSLHPTFDAVVGQYCAVALLGMMLEFSLHCSLYALVRASWPHPAGQHAALFRQCSAGLSGHAAGASLHFITTT